MTGLAQKGGAVFTHVRIARQPEDIHAVRLAAGGARLLLGCDIVVAASFDALAKVEEGSSRAVINSHATTVGEFTRKPDLVFPDRALQDVIAGTAGPGRTDFIDGTRLATALLGDSIATNLFMLGYAFQKGLVPVSSAAIERAIELNATAVETNKQAFLWGRRAAVDRAAVERLVDEANPEPASHRQATTLDEIVARRVELLTDYQDAAYAARYQALVEKVKRAEAERTPGRHGLAEAVARYYAKLLAYKDEYEVARLHSDGTLLAQIAEQFEGDYRLEFNLAAPIIARRDPATGQPIKRKFGPWMLNAFRLLAALKGLRGTRLDVFGYSAERRLERQLIAEYEKLVDEIVAGLDQDRHTIAVELASLPEQIRGYGHIKAAHLAKTRQRETELLAAFRATRPQRSAAE
jgi:indolepyruvate ferredoxin oxidoreductase